MKRQHIISLLLALLAIALFIWLLLFSGSAPQSGQATPSGKTARRKEHLHPPSGGGLSLERIGGQLDKMAIPIDFRGRIIDPEGRGITGARISWRAEVPGRTIPWGTNKTRDGSCVSGPGGGFEIHIGRGFGVSIRDIEKKGYRNAGRLPIGWTYINPVDQSVLPDPDRPVEFLMVPQNAQKAKRIFARSIKFEWNGSETRFPLGEKAGTLVFSAKRHVVKPDPYLPKYEWSIDMRLEIGQLQAFDGTINLAPAGGYKDSIHFGSADRKNNSRWFFFRTKDGLYGKLNFDVYPDRDKTTPPQASLYVFLNETGARNLEWK